MVGAKVNSLSLACRKHFQNKKIPFKNEGQGGKAVRDNLASKEVDQGIERMEATP